MSKNKGKKKPKQSASRGGNLLYKRGMIAVFGLACLLYANTLGHGYVLDDAIVISQNDVTQKGISGIPDLLTKDTFFGFFKQEGKSRLVAGGRYRPLTPVMFAVEHQLFGMRPWVGHLVNILLYALTGLAVYLLMFEVLSRTRYSEQAVELAALTGLLFIAHPIHTEAVANIKGRDEIMSLLLALASVLMMLRSWGKLTFKEYAIAALLFFLALTSKENAITFLAVIPLLLFYFYNAPVRKALVSTLPFAGAALLFLIVRGAVIGWELGDPPMELLNNPYIKIEGGRYMPFSTAEKSATIMYTLGKYVQLLFIPHPLTHDYYPRHIEIMSWADWRVLLSALVYAGLGVVGAIGLKKKSILSFGILYYLITLSIVSNIVFPVGTNMSERFVYMPSLGWAIACAALLAPLLIKRRTAVIGLAAIVIVAFSVKTIWRNVAWKSNLSLFTTDIETSKRSAKLLAATAGELITRGAEMPEGSDRDAQMRRGVAYIADAQKIHPNYKLSYLLRGNGYFYLGEWDNAIASYNRVLEIEPGNTDAQKNLGISYRDGGKYYGQEVGDFNKAIQYLVRAVELLPEDYESVHALGVAYGLAGQPTRAVEMFERGVEISPENATAHFNLGLAYQQIGDVENAQKHRNIAIQLDPEIINRRSRRE